ncbi:MAG: HEAT repeat domain-containing protein [Candidatus Heimdallarchaeota archaeon]|nr:HEAT repeat domain-containing protein [Candidatus Heimdallarchaeota archaeon]
MQIEDKKKEITKYLRDLSLGSNEKKIAAAYMLGILGKNNKKVIAALTNAMKNEIEEVRNWAAISLGELGEQKKNTIPILIEILQKEESEQVKSLAVAILGDIGEKMPQTIPALKDAINDENWRVREQAAYAIERLEQNKNKILQK